MISSKIMGVRNKSLSDKRRNDVKSRGTSRNDVAFMDTEIPKFQSYYMKVIGLVLKRVDIVFWGAEVFADG
jgi:hypothetical protein